MSTTNKNDEVPTLLVKDSQGSDLLCFLEQVVPLDGNEYALLTPVDTPVLGDLIVLILTKVVGRSIGLIGRGIAQGMGRNLSKG